MKRRKIIFVLLWLGAVLLLCVSSFFSSGEAKWLLVQVGSWMGMPAPYAALYTCDAGPLDDVRVTQAAIWTAEAPHAPAWWPSAHPAMTATP